MIMELEIKSEKLAILYKKLLWFWKKKDGDSVTEIAGQITEMKTPEAYAILVNFEDETGYYFPLVPEYFPDEYYLFEAIIGCPNDIDFFLYHLKFDIHEEYEPATLALIKIGARATNRLLSLLEEIDDESLKYQIVEFLTQVGDPRALESLVKFSKENEMGRYYLNKFFKGDLELIFGAEEKYFKDN